MFLIRPISVFAATTHSHLSLNQKLLISWFAPRGIVADAIASLFVIELSNHGFADVRWSFYLSHSLFYQLALPADL